MKSSGVSRVRQIIPPIARTHSDAPVLRDGSGEGRRGLAIGAKVCNNMIVRRAIYAAPDRGTVEVPDVSTDEELKQNDLYSVLLHNDPFSEMAFVVKALMTIFGHTRSLAMKIMYEAHHRGVALAEVEEKGLAERHCRQLLAMGLTATVEKAV